VERRQSMHAAVANGDGDDEILEGPPLISPSPRALPFLSRVQRSPGRHPHCWGSPLREEELGWCRCSGSVEEQKLVRTRGRRRSRAAAAAAAAAASMNAGPVGTGAWPDHDGNSGFLKLKRSKRRKTQWFYTNFLASAHLAHDGG
jgi:hypothetical protein